MGQQYAKNSICYGEDKIIRMERGFSAKHFPGGIATVFFNSMLRHKDKVAQIDGSTGTTQTYSVLLQRSIRTALEMRSRGIRSKDIVSICSHNHLDTVVPFYATLFLGAIPASLDPTLSLIDTTHLIKQVKPKMLFVSEEAVQLIEESLKMANLEADIVVFGDSDRYGKFSVFVEEKEGEAVFQPKGDIDDMDACVVFFSSGTTGLPKGISLTHYGLLNNTSYFVDGIDFSVILLYSSLYWISAIGMISSATMAGGARVIDRQFDARRTWNYIEKYKVSFAFLTVNASMDFSNVDLPLDLIDTTSLKIYMTGGERVSANLMNNLRAVLPHTFVMQAYGQTEVSGVLTGFNPNVPEEVEMALRKPDSCGRPVSTIDLYKVVDVETGHTVGVGEPGELRVKSNFFMKGYYNLDSSTAYDEDGFIKTGDVVYYDNEFCFFVVDRIKEMLKYRSWHVAPAMLEEVLLTHPAVEAAVVVGIPDKEDGEHPMACVILKQGVCGVSDEEIREYVDERVDDRKKLRGGVVFVKSFPTTATGKISRRLLRNLNHRAG